MARKHSRRHSRGRRHSRAQRGGNSWTSGSTYGTYVNGSGDAQFDRTFSSTGIYGSRMGTEYVGAQGQWANQPNTPSASNLALIQSAGRRKRRGGFLGAVISQAIVPAAILGLQQTYRRKGNSGNRTFRNKKFSRRH